MVCILVRGRGTSLSQLVIDAEIRDRGRNAATLRLCIVGLVIYTAFAAGRVPNIVSAVDTIGEWVITLVGWVIAVVGWVVIVVKCAIIAVGLVLLAIIAVRNLVIDAAIAAGQEPVEAVAIADMLGWIIAAAIAIMIGFRLASRTTPVARPVAPSAGATNLATLPSGNRRPDVQRGGLSQAPIPVGVLPFEVPCRSILVN